MRHIHIVDGIFRVIMNMHEPLQSLDAIGPPVSCDTWSERCHGGGLLTSPVFPKHILPERSSDREYIRHHKGTLPLECGIINMYTHLYN